MLEESVWHNIVLPSLDRWGCSFLLSNTLKDQMCLAAWGYPGHFFPCLRVSLESALGQAVFVELEPGSNSLLCRFLWRKKNTRVARPGRELKKEKEVEGGWWGECGVERKCDPLVLWRWNLDFTPLFPFLNTEGWILPSQACKVRLKSVCL